VTFLQSTGSSLPRRGNRCKKPGQACVRLVFTRRQQAEGQRVQDVGAQCPQMREAFVPEQALAVDTALSRAEELGMYQHVAHRLSLETIAG